MKVIVAGMSKTGTKTLHAALSELGYNVYDFMEHFWEHGKYWDKILSQGGTVADFREMYKDVDAVVDMPANAFWEEIHEAFPEAKIILTMREENLCVDGLYEQIKSLTNTSISKRILGSLSPTARRLLTHVHRSAPPSFGVQFVTHWSTFKPNKMFLRKKFREHNCYVMQNAPKDKLLVFNVQQGWETLCKFLGKDVPEKPFPWKNKNGSEISKVINQHKISRQMEKELLAVLACFVLIVGVFLLLVSNLLF